MKFQFILLSAFISFRSLSFAVDTTIKGGKMELANKGETILFKGGVTLERGQDTLMAEEMETDKTRDKVKARGKVELIRRVSETETCKGYGRLGFYNTKTGEGYLVGTKPQAHVIDLQVLSSTATRRIDIYADRFDFARSSSTANGTGSVYGKTVDPDTGDFYEFWSDRGDYNGAERKITLTGKKNQPVVHQINGENKRTVHGDTIIYYIDSRRMESEGNSKAIFVDAKEKEIK